MISLYHGVFPSKRKVCLYLNLLLFLRRIMPCFQPWCSLFSHFCFFLFISVKLGEGSFVNLHLSHHDSQKSLDLHWIRGEGGDDELWLWMWVKFRRLNAKWKKQNLTKLQRLGESECGGCGWEWAPRRERWKLAEKCQVSQRSTFQEGHSQQRLVLLGVRGEMAAMKPWVALVVAGEQ